MTGFLTSQLNKERFSLSLATAMKFVGIGVLWIVLSDLWLFFTQSTSADHLPLFHMEVVKGIAFVLAMGVFIFFTLRRYSASIEINDLDLFAKNPQPMWIISSDTLRFLDVNDAAINTYGYVKAEFLSMTIFDIKPEAEFEKVRRVLQDAGSGSRFLGQTRHLKKDKTAIHVLIGAYPIMFHFKHALLVVANDITRQVQAEEMVMGMQKEFEKKLNDSRYEMALYTKELQVRIREVNGSNNDLIEVNKLLQEANNRVNGQLACARERYHTQMLRMAGNVDQPFWVIDLKNPDETFISKRASELFGVSKASITDRPGFWEDCISENDKKHVENALRDLETKGKVELIYSLKSSEDRISHTIELIRDENDEPSKIECFLRVG